MNRAADAEPRPASNAGRRLVSVARAVHAAYAVRVALFVGAALLLVIGLPRPVRAFGEEGAFNPRPLLTGNARWEGVRVTAPARWSEELERRTSAPARRAPTPIRADDPALLAEPFVLWGGDADIPPLTTREVTGLQRFIAMGGILFVDDFAPEGSADAASRPTSNGPGDAASHGPVDAVSRLSGNGAFGKAARRELARVIPEGSPIPIGPESVVFRSFYLLQRAVGRVEGPPKLSAIVRGGLPQVLFSAHDVSGALARSAGGPSVAVTPGGEPQRERAIRLAVNVAMYVLCSNYKDDQVHAPVLMRRRQAEPRDPTGKPGSAPGRPGSP